MTLEQLRREQRAVVSLGEAARLLGIGLTAAKAQARDGRLGPVTVLRVGRLYRVPVAGLQRTLGVDPVAAAPAATEAAERRR